MKELNGKRIVVLSPGMMANMFMNSYRTNYTYYDEAIKEPTKTVQKYKTLSSTPTAPWKEKKLKRNKQKSQR